MLGYKLFDFMEWCKIAKLMKNCSHLTQEGLKQITKEWYATIILIFNCMINLTAMHNQRFFSYLTLFSFCMILLVTADNYLLMFLAWEGIGVVSYLLINFWFTRIAATKAAVLALTQNRVGDTLLTLGLFGILWTVGNLDYSTVFSIIPYMNETSTTIIALLLLGGASAKSAQLFLNTWLPHSMEGLYLYSV
jgi:NADH-ubiquinone oxidoreductase chain 5